MSTSYALTELINEITAWLNNKMCSLGVFIDLKKAFDTVDHELLSKTKHVFMWYQRCSTQMETIYTV